MSITKTNRDKKKQLGQYMTPTNLSYNIVKNLTISPKMKILEPSFGDGSFIMNIIDHLINQGLSFDNIMEDILYGVELDKELYDITINKIEQKYGTIKKHNLINDDFLLYNFNIKFTNIIGNPPFGGTINTKYQDHLDKIYGNRMGNKIKKETYSFFVVKCMDILSTNGELTFICSDTFLSINTMAGLRKYMVNNGSINIESLSYFSEETNYPMVILNYVYGNKGEYVTIDNNKLNLQTIELTPNYSWNMDKKWIKYFNGDKLSKYITASGGLSTGKNEYFIRDIINDKIIESYNFEYFNDPITLEKELSNAKNNKLGNKKINEIKNQQLNGDTRVNVRITEVEPYEVDLPNENYCLYNKATSEKFYSKPKNVIYWDEDGKAVITYKKNGNWYLHGVGGKSFYKKEGLTWQLISKTINVRYLPSGYIMDNSSPVAILKEGIPKDELYFIIGWLLTDLATQIQKQVLNHTKNNQNKDIERLPYPFWVDDNKKEIIINVVKESIECKMGGINIDEIKIIENLNELFGYNDYI